MPFQPNLTALTSNGYQKKRISATSLPKNAKYGTLVPNRVFVGGLSTETTEDELYHVFARHGTVLSAKIILDRFGKSKGYGFVTFKSELEARRMTADPEGVVLRDRKLNIQPAIRKNIISSANTSVLFPTNPLATTTANNQNPVDMEQCTIAPARNFITDNAVETPLPAISGVDAGQQLMSLYQSALAFQQCPVQPQLSITSQIPNQFDFAGFQNSWFAGV